MSAEPTVNRANKEADKPARSRTLNFLFNRNLIYDLIKSPNDTRGMRLIKKIIFDRNIFYKLIKRPDDTRRTRLIKGLFFNVNFGRATMVHAVMGAVQFLTGRSGRVRTPPSVSPGDAKNALSSPTTGSRDQSQKRQKGIDPRRADLMNGMRPNSRHVR
jgi:hypothetical protein